MIVNIENFDFEKINEETADLMNYLNDYLENGWKIKKNNNCYIISNNKSKIYTLDSINVKGHIIYNNKQKYIIAFIYNGLNNGWSIKKNNSEYIFSKNHEGKKEILSDSYINTFLKENFNFNLIK
jgi:hypothetical protein|uniref:Uncharacterized protein n=1 Tax=viral metagenome TaxID=1070528 RepID=A0A6C0CK00_9ZZZZ